MLRYEDLISFTTDFTDGPCSSSITSCWYGEVAYSIQIQLRTFEQFFIPLSYSNISSTLLDTRQSATPGRFQDRAPWMESLEVVDLWNLFHHRLRCLSSNGQETTIWWHTGWIIRNVKNCLTKEVSKHPVKKRRNIPGWHRQSWHPLRPGRSQNGHNGHIDMQANGLPCWRHRWLVFRCRETRGAGREWFESPSTISSLSRKVFVLLCKRVFHFLTWIHCSGLSVTRTDSIKGVGWFNILILSFFPQDL